MSILSASSFDFSESDHSGSSIDSHIIDGSDSTPTSWRSQAQIQLFRGRNGFRHACGGSVLNKNWVITAAHCVTRRSQSGASYSVVRPDYVRVRVGHLDRIQPEETMQESIVGRVVVHPDYDPRFNRNDVALLNVRDAFEFTAWVQPARVASEPIGASEFGVAVGWGKTAASEPSSRRLLYAELPLIDSATCSSFFQDALSFPAFQLDPNSVCAGYPDGVRGVCKGDSGGPLFVPRKNGASGSDLVGLTSWGLGGSNLCGGYGVFARVAPHKDWIEQVSGPGVLVGDVNADGCVDNDDLMLIFANADSTTFPANVDTDRNGIIDAQDYLNVLQNYGSCL